MERMVQTRTTPKKKVSRSSKKVKPVSTETIAPKVKFVKEEPTGVEEWAKTPLETKEEPIVLVNNRQETEPLVSDVETAEEYIPCKEAEKLLLTPKSKPIDYKALLAEAPEVPYIANIESAVKFVDKYAKWKSKVKANTS